MVAKPSEFGDNVIEAVDLTRRFGAKQHFADLHDLAE